MEPLISSSTNALFQVIILAVLFVSLGIKQRKKYYLHGITMFAAVILNILSFFLTMFPSVIRMEILNTQPLHTISIITLIHSGLGLLSIMLGIWLVASWHLQSSFKNCFKNKRLMRVTTTLWMLVLMMGFLLYYLLYI